MMENEDFQADGPHRILFAYLVDILTNTALYKNCFVCRPRWIQQLQRILLPLQRHLGASQYSFLVLVKVQYG
jgi:hypothetical protein